MPVLESLLKLFRVDAQVRGLRSRLDAASRYLQTQDRQHRDLQQRLDELTTRRKQTQAKAGNLEGEIASIDLRLEKLRDELNSSANNKQYAAALTELNTVKANRANVEKQALEQMQQVEQIEGEITALTAQVSERARLREIARGQLAERQAEVGQRLAELEAERAVAAEQCPQRELEIFNHVADMYDGEAMARIEEIDRRNREYACGSCNMHVPFEQVSLLMNAGTALVRCTACHRILYMHEETRGSIARK